MSVRTLEGPKDRIVFECDDCGVEHEMNTGEAPDSETCKRCTQEREREAQPYEDDIVEYMSHSDADPGL